jgi:hypothetical protein
MSVVEAKDRNSARPRQPMVHQELPRGFGTSMLESTFAIDMSRASESTCFRLTEIADGL